MDTADIVNELNAIRIALEGRASPTITGSQLSTLISSTAPDVDIRAVVGKPAGSGALTEFVRRHLSDVLEPIGNQGCDILHRIKGREFAELPPAASPEVWRTFVSPNSVQHLVLMPSVRRLVVRSTPASTADGELEVAKASTSEHDEMRADFMAAMSEPDAKVLKEHVASDTDFLPWIAALREHLPESTRQWGYYRRERLAKLFVARITALKLEVSLHQDVLKQIRTAELSAYDVRKDREAVLSTKMPRKTGRTDAASDATTRARQLAHAAIDALAYDELRALRRPLGAMLDAIRAEN